MDFEIGLCYQMYSFINKEAKLVRLVRDPFSFYNFADH